MEPKIPIKMKAIVHMIFSFLLILREFQISYKEVTTNTPFDTIPVMSSWSAPGKCKIFINAPTSDVARLMKKLHVTSVPSFIGKNGLCVKINDKPL
jgi:hypothetical protein